MLTKLKLEWKECIENALKKISALDDIPPLAMAEPPKSELGDVAFPLFSYSKSLRKAPQKIAEDVKAYLLENGHPEGEIILAGAYFNVKLSIENTFRTQHLNTNT